MPIHPNAKILGIMKPLGGGDPVPLKKDELLVGRRPRCDIVLDFENISGKHCQLRMIKGVWHVRDLGSTNGTTVNGQKIFSEHGLMPDDELGIAGHLYFIDYDPIAPTSLIDANHILEEEMVESPRNRSLMELAGIETEDRPRRSRAQAQQTPPPADRPAPAAPKPKPEQLDLDEQIPADIVPAKVDLTDDDFLKLIQDDVVEHDHKSHKPPRK